MIRQDELGCDLAAPVALFHCFGHAYSPLPLRQSPESLTHKMGSQSYAVLKGPCSICSGPNEAPLHLLESESILCTIYLP